MKLGEALSLRARQAQQLNNLRARIKANVLVQEGEEAAEAPLPLIEEFERVSDEHAKLVQRIVRTNIEYAAVNDDNMLDLLHHRETLRRKRNLHEMVANSATPSDRSNVFRYSRSEIRFVPNVAVNHHREVVEELDQAIRRIDSILQESNWKLDLVG